MDAMVRKCAGLDVHQETIVACVLKGELDKKPQSEIRTFDFIVANPPFSVKNWKSGVDLEKYGRFKMVCIKLEF